MSLALATDSRLRQFASMPEQALLYTDDGCKPLCTMHVSAGALSSLFPMLPNGSAQHHMCEMTSSL